MLGQYKEARAIDPMVELGRKIGGRVELRAVGRGWPAIPGWDVRDDFVTESEFTRELQEADAVLLPYKFYQQSGVMVRAFELGIPVVGTPHPQLAQLYGQTWPGTVQDADWGSAVEQTLGNDTEAGLLRRKQTLIAEIDASLSAHLNAGIK
ncbi:hypothetical protein HNR24_000941 [Nesterenkonia jeotgali]|uniref:Glycosyl transferase family 1 domain-containing protein n=1 Tax=Nesterenkonia jeotgali TaxID=317018 RepID=A0A839FGY9_9MICC|nr:hypothetical protein [Nesterenkonia jeotgali]MBA8921008.1 hypothetical protein [Nesterenkonia jeotgali]